MNKAEIVKENKLSCESGIMKQVSLEKIDQSIRCPVLNFLSFSLIWLLIGTGLALLLSISLYKNNCLVNSEWLSFGKLQAVQSEVLIYGWASNAAFGIATWIMARLSFSDVRHGGMLTIAGIFWNVALSVGVLGILLGDMTSVPYLQLPTYVFPLMLAAYVLIAVWSILSFYYRSQNFIYVSQLYLFAALFCFPWIYSIAEVMVVRVPARGVIQSIVQAWYANNLFALWLVPVGLATSYYLIPKILGKPIRGYYLSFLGFWTWIIFTSWSGGRALIGGPVPAWIGSVGTVFSVLMIVPVIIIAFNHRSTVWSSLCTVCNDKSLRFIVFGAISFTIAHLIYIVTGMERVNEITQFSYFVIGHENYVLYGFFSMIVFGAMYFMVPEFLKRPWPCWKSIRIHFVAVGIGIIICALSMMIGGFLEGMELNQSTLPFVDLIRNMRPWLLANSLGMGLILLGNLIFFIHFCGMLLNLGKGASCS